MRTKQGPPGPEGPEGPPGKTIIGPKGDKGDPGILATKALEEVKPGEEVKTLQIEIVTITGPQGPKGDSIQGPPGPQGPPGKSIEGPPGKSIKGDKGDPGLDGEDGREIELRYSATHIQWRYVGDKEWVDLLEIKALQNAGAGGLILKLSALGDVKITNLLDGQVIKYNSILKKWENVFPEDIAATWGNIGGLISAQTDLQTALGLKINTSAIDTDGTLAANSDAKIASQKATKTYVDQIIAAQDAMVFKGAVDCSANPNYPAADRGWTYRVSVAGKIGGASGINVEVGDMFICLDDNTSSGTQAAQGTHWAIIQTNIDGAVIGPASATDLSFAQFDGTSGKLLKSTPITLDTDTALAANSDTKIASQKATKAYVDGQNVQYLIKGLYDIGNSGSSVAIDWRNGRFQKVTMTANCAFSVSNFPPIACEVTLFLIQGASNYQGTYSSDLEMPAGRIPQLSSTNGARDALGWYYDGTKCRARGQIFDSLPT